MKRLLLAFAVAAVSATWIGCQQADSPAGTADAQAPTETTQVLEDGVTFVSLSVPNMT